MHRRFSFIMSYFSAQEGTSEKQPKMIRGWFYFPFEQIGHRVFEKSAVFVKLNRFIYIPTFSCQQHCLRSRYFTTECFEMRNQSRHFYYE